MNKLFLFIFFLTFFAKTKAQTFLFEGTYKGEDKIGVLKTLTLKNSGFTLIDHNEVETIGEGKFEINKDSLILNFSEIKDPDTSIYTVDSSTYKAPKGIKIFHLRVFDWKDKQPLNYSLIVLRDSLDEAMMHFTGDKDGKANIWLYKPSLYEYISVGFFGYDFIKIPIKTFSDASANNISIYLKEESGIDTFPRGRKSYKIVKKAKNSFTLVMNGENIIFTKELPSTLR